MDRSFRWSFRINSRCWFCELWLSSRFWSVTIEFPRLPAFSADCWFDFTTKDYKLPTALFSRWAWFWKNHWTFFLALWGEFFKRDAWDFLDSTRSFSHNSQKCLTDGFLKSSLFTELLQDYPKRWEWSQQFGLLVSLNQGIRISILFIRPSPTIALASHSGREAFKNVLAEFGR